MGGGGGGTVDGGVRCRGAPRAHAVTTAWRGHSHGVKMEPGGDGAMVIVNTDDDIDRTTIAGYSRPSIL